MKKAIWITSLNHDEEKAKQVYETAHKYGLDTGGHFWIQGTEKMEWAGAGPELNKPETSLWIIAGAVEDFKNPENRIGLSLLTALVQGHKGYGFPILIVPYDGALTADDLPTPLKGAEIVTMAGLGPKVAAKANIPMKKVAAEYRLDLYPLVGLGLWIEVGPGKGHSWKGALFGVNEGEVNAHGVGPAGKLPDKCVLEYPMQGLTIQAGESEYTAWAVQNELTENDSYYIRVTGDLDSLLFGELAQDEDADVFIVGLK